MKINVGIFFGGPSREREISFAGGRTVYDNLNQTLFNPVPIFVDSFRNWVLLDWQYIYKGSIRDFYPPIDALPSSENNFQIYLESIEGLNDESQQALLKKIGQPILKSVIKEHVDIAFLALHGEYGEDGQLQQELENLDIPYTGCGVEASQLGMDKALQKQLMQQQGFACPKVNVLNQTDWLGADLHSLYQQTGAEIGFPIVVRPANQGSSIGVSIIEKEDGLEGFEQAVNRAFFRELISLDEWQDRSAYERIEYVKLLGDIRDGLGFPLHITLGSKKQTIYHPEGLLSFLNKETEEAEHLSQVFVLEGAQSERNVILESFIKGKEFSCIVIRTEDGSAIALPPTEIIKGGEVFDYRSKYMPGLSRKETPIQLEAKAIEAIRRECETLFSKLKFQVYARIDGFYTEDGTIYLNDPNTTSGMLPSSFFFHQAAEIGLNPSQFLTYIIRISLQERLVQQENKDSWRTLLRNLDEQIEALHSSQNKRRKIGVILGGYSFERHISVESGRNIFEKLASSVTYEPIPVFLTGSSTQQELFQLPINLLLKDNADDIRDKIRSWKAHPILEQIRRECLGITKKYASANVVFQPHGLNYDTLAEKVDGVFIALHGRPGEDGQVQMQLEARHLPYNGPGVKSSSTTIDKFRTLQLLGKHSLPVARQLLLSKQDFNIDEESFYKRIEQQFQYPFISKPVDDGCSSAVKVIKNREELSAYAALLFRVREEKELNYRRTLKLKIKEEFPIKGEALFEELITQNTGIHFLEITGGMLTHYSSNGNLQYEIFEPSETLASGEILSLEEKFLAGEGQNLTPARLAVGNYSYEHVLKQVQHTLERAARLLDVESYCRIDAFVRVLPDGKVETQIIEINSLPGMTPATAIFHQAALAGYKPADFIDKILSFGFERTQKKQGLKPIALAVEQQVTEVETSLPTSSSKQVQTLFKNKNTDEQPMETTPAAPNEPSVSKLKQSFERIKKLITSPYFLKNIGAMFGVVIIAFLLLNIFLNLYTGHGNSVQVENYTGLTIEDAKKKASARGFKISVNEAPFSQDLAPGEVIGQEPLALNRIKKNRTIYLTIIGGAKSRVIPPFNDAGDNYKRYAPKLSSLQISSVVKQEIFDAKLAAGTILHFYYRGKKYTPNDVKRGVKILQGSTLEFVISKNKDDNVRLPSLICKRYSEVAFLLPSLELKLGKIEGGVSNRADAFVWKQEPVYNPGAKILRGSTINLYLQAERPAGCPAEIEVNEPESDSGGIPEPELDQPEIIETDTTTNQNF